ncbi:esterase-like activity of phytase family protein [Candidatus Solirubrobacter pratensis]|uniref:esterase-like activity of phytase family protein n=1 Tax=Candidatus Solirubrobacter pratensis TaxID=1298857 RepID=UPI000429C103|nr:esterase-like activity of phytase family protein [Candidatus Solirubrobacter pratensis]
MLHAALISTALVAVPATAGAATSAQLEGRAVLPAATFADGPPSGALLGSAPVNGVPVPFSGQPVQGFSGAIPAGDGRYWVMEDNGYGQIENSADFNLRVYLMKPSFETAVGGPGTVKVQRFIELHDPAHKVPFAIVHNWTSDRVLTGADFDIESIQRAPDGTLWFGDEFGPFLIHTDETGKVLHAPYPLPDPDHPGQELRAAQNPYSEESSTLRVMNALRGDAQAHGDAKAPIVSPDANLLADNDATTFEPTRKTPPPGLKAASSELMSVSSLHAAGFKVVPYTVDDPVKMDKLIKLGVDGLISDRPDLAHQVAVQDGVDLTTFDVEGHRGGRDLRPENTLPAMEAGLDNLVTTLETDNHLTKDGVPVLSHDPYVDTGKCRLADGKPYTFGDEVLIKTLTLEQLQSKYICDGIIRTGTPQSNDRKLSPVAVAFAKKQQLADPYVDPTTQQLFDFVDFYVTYYKTGAGKDTPGATEKWQNAEKVHFNIETKLNPRSGRDYHNNVYTDRTPDHRTIERAVTGVIESNDMAARSDIQSFDFDTLRDTYQDHPDLATVALWGDDPVFAGNASTGESGDGTNLQPEGKESNTRWLAGLYWPYRHTADENPFRVQTSGGFEGMAITADGKDLRPMLEKPEAGATQNRSPVFDFNLKTEGYTRARWWYPYDPTGVSVGDYQLFDGKYGLAIERDNSQGDLNGFKALEQVKFGKPGTVLSKTEAADLMHIDDRSGISLPALPGDVGLGHPFAFPFQTIEDVVFLDNRTVLVINDNNFPFSIGRHPGSGKPDDDEFIVLELPQAIGK